MTSQGAPEAGAWKTVPVEPTEAMHDAGTMVPNGIGGCPPHASNVWAAMLAASPSPPPRVGERPKEDLGNDHWVDVDPASLAAHGTRAPVEVEVVKLEWVGRTGPGMPVVTIRAETVVGYYEIEVQSDNHLGKYWLSQQQTVDKKVLRFNTLQEAEVSAQADFERRIRSALVPSQQERQRW